MSMLRIAESEGCEMTTRLKGLTVALTHDIREDDAQSIIDAIGMIKGVLDVQPIEVNGHEWVIETRIQSELRKKLFEALEDKKKC